MSAKHPRFEPMTIDIRLDGRTYRARAYDARRPSALRAVERVLQVIWDQDRHDGYAFICKLAEAAGMTARVVNGKIKCQWRDK